jgi:uncharacterized protein
VTARMPVAFLVVAAGSIAGLCALLLAAVYVWQEALLFDPVPLARDYRYGLAGVDEVGVPVDGARLSALHLRLPDPQGLVFYLHGNAGNLTDWFVDPDFYRAANYDLFMIDYRSYGKSSGRIESEAQLRADVAAAWRQVAPRYRGRRRVIIGRSLGTALAAGLAASAAGEDRPDLTILVSAYWSMGELARLHYPMLPVRLLRYPLETDRDIARIDGPVLLLHGDRDALIPIDSSERLQRAARSARLVTVVGAAHNDIQEFAAYRDAVAQALGALGARSP